MTEFGQLLRKFRHRCNSSTSPHGKLTQEKFGELVGAKLGISYTGAAVSDWERGKSKIHADDRALLMALIEVLYDHGGIKTAAEANQLLKARNARDLVPEELTRIFNEGIPDSGGGSADSEQKATKPLIFSIMRRVLSIPEDQLPGLMAKAREGPPPSWPRVVVAFIRQFSDQLSVFHVLKSVLWIWVWLLTWALIAPSLRWPFPDQDNALLAITAYAFGSLLIPALIGALTNTKDNKFWQQQQGVSNLILRLYTHQGASIGFHVGYFFVFMFGLLLYNFGWRSLTWVELLGSAFLVALGYASARLVPYNLSSAYKQLHLQDGRIFFIFFLVGPAWGYFFLGIHDILLRRSLGIFIVLSSLTLLLVMMALRYRQSGTTVIPVYWWVIFWGSLLLCQFLAFLLK